MKASFLNSTLSLCFILCVLTVIAMIFLGIEMPEYGDEVIIGIISAYLTARGVNSKTEVEHAQGISKEEETLLLTKYSAHDPKE